MDNCYINELIGKLEATEFWNGTGKLCDNYNEAVQMLLDAFTKHKKNQSQLFFIDCFLNLLNNQLKFIPKRTWEVSTVNMYKNCLTTIAIINNRFTLPLFYRLFQKIYM